ncbi:hypothetical protein L0222_13285 [bacterium]|nr:hypothetical protein [bacterium]MCI0603017.1 hypothetical protein [bacterium]
MNSPLEKHQKVFGIGLARTGTTSLCRALNLLGIPTIHYPCGEEIFSDLKNGNYKLSIMRKYQGAADIPVAPFYPQLDQEFPGSKFILTIREEDSWIRSVENHWRRSARWLGEHYAFIEFIRACVFGTIDFNEDRFRYVYRTHFRNVTEYFAHRPDDLLAIDVCKGEGWEKLCPFLGFPIPDIPFPSMNQTEGKWDDMDRVDAALKRALSILPPESNFILIGRGKVGNVTPALFTGLPGLDWGAPENDQDAIQEIDQITKNGTRFLVFLWPFFWWFEYFPELHSHLQRNFHCLASNNDIVIYAKAV